MEISGKRRSDAARGRLDRLKGWVAAQSLTLRVRIMGLVAVSVIIPAVLTGWMANTFLNRDLRRELYSNSKIRNENLAAAVSAWFSDRIGQVRAFTTSSYLFSEQVVQLARGSKGEDVAKAQADVDRYLAYLLQDDPNFHGFAVLSERGTPLAVSPRSLRPFLDPLASKRFGPASSVFEADSKEGKKVFIVQRVGGADREVTVYLAGLLKTDALAKLIAKGIAVGAGDLAYLVDGEGAVKEASSAQAAGRTLPAAGRRLFESGVDAMDYEGLLGMAVIGSASRISVMDWWLVSETSRRHAFQDMARFRSYIVYMTLVIAGLLLLPALFVARTIVRPLEELSQAARKIRSGEVGIQVEPRTGGELGEFIHAFNAMSRSLLKSLEEIRATTQQLKVMSITDPLTGRANRRFMEEQLKRSLKIAQRTGAPLSVLMLDLDHFKRYNDTYGHLGGDEALKQVGDLLVGSVRDTDYVSRFGGEEFLISLEGATKENAAHVAEKIRAAVEGRAFTIGDAKTRITASLGVASYPEDGDSSKPLLAAADRALYTAKELGRNRVCLAGTAGEGRG